MADTEKGLRVLNAVKAFCYAFTATAILFIYTPLANWMARPLTMEPRLEKADLIVVLGGGAYRDGTLTAASNERLIHGLLLYRQGRAPRVIFSGGTITDPGAKFVHTVTGSTSAVMDAVESLRMEEIANGLGIPESDTVADVYSTNTYENMVDVKEYMVKNGLSSCLLVSSPVHMLRAMSVAKKLGVSCAPAPVDDYTPHRKTGIDRLSLARETAHEYAGLVYYRILGYL